MASKYSSSSTSSSGSSGETQKYVDDYRKQYNNLSAYDMVYSDKTYEYLRTAEDVYGKGHSANHPDYPKTVQGREGDESYNALVGFKTEFGDNVDNKELSRKQVVDTIKKHGNYMTENYNMRNSERTHRQDSNESDAILEKLINEHAIIQLPNGNYMTNLQGFDDDFASKIVRDTSD